MIIDSVDLRDMSSFFTVLVHKFPEVCHNSHLDLVGLPVITQAGSVDMIEVSQQTYQLLQISKVM